MEDDDILHLKNVLNSFGLISPPLPTDLRTNT